MECLLFCLAEEAGRSVDLEEPGSRVSQRDCTAAKRKVITVL